MFFIFFPDIEFAAFLECMHAHKEIEKPEKELLNAFKSHDKERRGYVNASEARHILMNLGEKLSSREGMSICLEKSILSVIQQSELLGHFHYTKK